MWDLGKKKKSNKREKKDSESVWVLRKWNSFCEQTESQVV